MNDIPRRKVLPRILVESFVELAQKLLEYRSHRGIVDEVGMEIYVLEAFDHFEDEASLVQF